SGLSASIINRMLSAPELPALARSKILEYIEEKSAGLYGGTGDQRRRFAARLAIAEGGCTRKLNSGVPTPNLIAPTNHEQSRVTAEEAGEPLDFLENY